MPTPRSDPPASQPPPPALPLPPAPDPVIEAYKKDIDRTLIRASLKLTVTERFENLMELQRFAEELRRAGKAARKA